jgi:hypothetical protein
MSATTVTAAKHDAFADFDPLCATAATTTARTTTEIPAKPAAPDVTPQLPSRSRSQRRRAARKQSSGQRKEGEQQAGAAASGPTPAPASGLAPAPRTAAPWEDDPEADAAEQKEANRAALKKALRNKRQQRSSKFALSQSDAHEAGAAGTMPADPSAMLPAGLDAKMLQTILRKTGHATADAPSMRKLKRAMQSMPAGYLAALGAAAGK